MALIPFYIFASFQLIFFLWSLILGKTRAGILLGPGSPKFGWGCLKFVKRSKALKLKAKKLDINLIEVYLIIRKA